MSRVSLLQRLLRRAGVATSKTAVAAKPVSPAGGRQDFRLEPSEPRLLLSADPVFDLSTAGVLTVQLGDNADILVVNQLSKVGTAGTEGVILSLNIGGQTFEKGDSTHGVKSLVIQAGAGNDHIDISGVTVGTQVDGGAGQDSLIVWASGTPGLSYQVDGPDAGRLLLGSSSTQFTGMEPVRVITDTGYLGDVRVSFGDEANDASLSWASTEGQLRLSSNKAAGDTGSFSSLTFNTPVGQSLTLAMGSGLDRWVISDLRTHGVFATYVVDPEDMVVSQDVRLDGSLSLNTSGQLTVNPGVTIAVGQSLALSASATLGQPFAAIRPGFQQIDLSTSVSVGSGARLAAGGDISIRSIADNTRSLSFQVDDDAVQRLDVNQRAALLAPTITTGTLLNFAAGASGGSATITRSDANSKWSDEGFAVGMAVLVTGSNLNDGVYHIKTLSGAVMTLADGETLRAENGTAGVTLDGVTAMSPGVPAGTLDFVVNANGSDALVRSSGSWLSDGFRANEIITIGGTPDGKNDGEYLILAVDETTLTVAATLGEADKAFEAQSNVAGAWVTTRGRASELPVAMLDSTVEMSNRTSLVFSAAGGTVTRSGTGSWLVDGFAVGQEVQIQGSARNDGVWRVTAVTAQSLTLSSATAGKTLADETTSVAEVSAANGVEGGAPEGDSSRADLTLSFAGNTVTRNLGAWTDEGFAVGQVITIAGTQNAANSGEWRVAAINGAVMTLEAPGFTSFTAESSTTAKLAYAVSLVSPTLEFNAATDTITRSSGSWLTDGFVAGGRIAVNGSTSNDGVYRVDSISSDGKTLHISFAAGMNLSLDNEVSRYVSVQGVLSNEIVNPGGGGSAPTMGQVVSAAQGVVDTTAQMLPVVMQILRGKVATLALAEASSSVKFESGVVVEAGGAVEVASTTVAKVKSQHKGSTVGLTYVRSEGSAGIDVGAGVVINAQGHVGLDSRVDNTLQAESSAEKQSSKVGMLLTSIKPGEGGPALTLAVGIQRTNVATSIGSGATILGQSVDLSALAYNNLIVKAGSAIAGIETANSAQGLALAISDAESKAQVQVDGEVRARTGDIRATATSQYWRHETRAVASVERQYGMSTKLKAELGGLMGWLEGSLPAVADAGEIGAAAAFAAGFGSNQSSVTLGSAGKAQGNSVWFTSRAEDNPKTSASARALQEAKTSLAAGIAFGRYTNLANTLVDGAIDATGQIRLRAEAEIPNPYALDERLRELLSFNPDANAPTPAPGTGSASGDFDTDLGAELNKQQGDLGAAGDWLAEALPKAFKLIRIVKPFIEYQQWVPNMLVGSYTEALGGTHSSASSDPSKPATAQTEVAISGSFNVRSQTNSASAKVGSQGRINQNTPAADAASLEVSADTQSRAVDIAGMANPLALALGNRGTSTVGGTCLAVDYNGVAEAIVADGALVRSDELKVNANQYDLLVAVAQAGGSAKKIGVSGAVGYYDSQLRTQAVIQDGASIDAAGALSLKATSEMIGIGVAGAIQTSDSTLAVGAGLVFNDVGSTTEAYIGHATGAAAATAGHVNAASVDVAAKQNQTLIAAAVAGTAMGGNASSDAAGPASAAAPSPVAGAGVGLSGASAVNLINENTRAWVERAPVVTALDANANRGNVSISANSSDLTVAAAGGFAVRTDDGSGAALAGAFAMNQGSRTTQSWLASSTTAGSVTLSAESGDLMVTAAAGAAGSKRTGTVNVAGSVTVDDMTDTTQAWIADGTVIQSGGDVSVRSKGNLRAYDVAGAVEVGARFGVGAAVAYSDLVHKVEAWVGQASVRAQGDLQVQADSDETVLGIAASLAANDSLGLAGSVANRTLVTSTLAEVRDNANVTLGGNAALSAEDDAWQLTIAGSAALGRNAGFGAAVATTDHTRVLAARIGAAVVLDAYAAQPGSAAGAVRGVRLTARASDDTRTAAGAGAGSEKLAAAAGVAASMQDSLVEATIGAGAMINQGVERLPGADQSVVLKATHTGNVLGVGGGLGIAGKVGIGAGADGQDVHRQVRAEVADNARVGAAQDISLTALADFKVLSVAAAGAVAYTGSGVAVDGAVNVLLHEADVSARVGSGAVLKAGNDVAVDADSMFNALTVAAGVAGGSGTGVGGSAAALDYDNAVLAQIGPNTQVTAGGDILVSSDGNTQVGNVAGSAGIGLSQFGVGASVAVAKLTESVQAQVLSGSVLKASGQGSSASVLRAVGDAETQDNGFHGVSVTAKSLQTATTFAVGGAFGGRAGIAGSVATVVSQQTVQALIARGSSTDAGSGDVNVYAASRDTLWGLGGALGLGGQAGIGAGVAVVTLDRSTEALLGGTVTTSGSIGVQALATEAVVVGAAGIGGGASYGVAGGGAATTLDLSTQASILADADVQAGGNVVLAADDFSSVDAVAGGLGIGGTAGVGGGAAVTLVEKNTQANIGAGAKVDAAGNVAGTVLAGGFSSPVFNFQSASLYEVTAPDSVVGNTSEDDPALTGQRSVNNLTRSGFRGVSVTATNRDDLEAVGVSVGASANVGVGISATATSVENTTQARVDASAQVNTRNAATANAGQTVQVAAASDLSHLGAAGAGAFALAGAAAPGADVIVVQQDTAAKVMDGAKVAAKGDVRITSDATEDSTSIAVAVAGAGTLSAAAGISVFKLESSSAAQTGNGAVIQAGGNAVIRAADRTDADMIAGSLALSLGGAFGGGIGVADVTKRTEASIGNGSVVDAAAQTAAEGGVLSGTLASGGGFDTAGARGIVVQAQSTEDITGLAASAAIGKAGGLAGAMTVNLIDADTLAAVGAGARLNTATTGENAAQSVVISASDRLDLIGADGVSAGGIFGGLSGGVDVAVVRNDTRAQIADSPAGRAQVQAKDSVKVLALADKHMDSLAISSGIGAAALGGSVSVINIGGSFDARYSWEDSEKGTQNGQSLASEGSSDGSGFTANVDQQSSNSGLIAALEGYDKQPRFSSGQISSNAIQLGSNPGWHTGDALIYRADPNSGAIAGLQDGQRVYAIVDANDPSRVKLARSRSLAMDGVAIQLGSGAGNQHSLGLVGDQLALGGLLRTTSGSRGHVTGNSFTAASTATSGVSAGTAAAIGANADVQAGQDINVSAREQLALTVDAGGTAAGLGGIGLSVVVVRNNSNVTASVGSGSQLDAGRNVAVQAFYDADLTLYSQAGTLAGLGVGGAVVYLADGSKVSAQLGDSVGIDAGSSFSLLSHLALDVAASTGSKVGAAAGAGAAVVVVNLSGASQAVTGAATRLGSENQAIGQVSIQAESTVAVGAPGGGAMSVALGIGGGVAAGGVALVRDGVSTTAGLGNDGSANISGDLSILSEGQHDLDVRVNGAALGAGAFGVVVAEGRINGATTAQVGSRSGNSNLKARDVKLSAQGRNSATVQALGAAGGGIASGAGAVATADVRPTVRAQVGSGAGIQTSRDFTVEALSDSSNVKATVAGVSLAGGVTAGVNLARADFNPTVEALVGDGAQISSAGSALIKARAGFSGSEVSAWASPFAGGGIAAATLTHADAEASANTRAALGAGVQISAGQSVKLDAYAINRAKAEGLSATVGLGAGLGLVKSDATVQGSTRAEVADSAAGARGLIEASSLTLSAQAEDRANARSTAASGGTLSANGSLATANAAPTLVASLGKRNDADISGKLSVTASYLPEADALARGYSGGVISAGASVAHSNLSPNVLARIDEGGLLKVGGDLEVVAERITLGAAPVDGVIAADAANDTLTYGDFGLDTGSAVEFKGTLAGLQEGRDYYVLRSTPVSGNSSQVKLTLGLSFEGQKTASGQGLDASNDTIVFAGGHGLKTGDSMVYDGSSGAALSLRRADGSEANVAVGTVLWVRVLDAQTIKLFDTQAAALNPGLRSFDPGALDAAADRIVLAGHGFSNGQAVTWRNAVDWTFTANELGLVLDSNGQPQTDSSGQLQRVANSQIYVAGGHGFTTGEAVEYHVESGGEALTSTGTPLVDGAIYYVIRISDTVMKLASSRANALAGASITLDNGGNTQTSHTFTDPGIGGLTAGRTYYVINAQADSFQLALTPAGVAIDLTRPTLDTDTVLRSQQIGSEGLDLLAGDGTMRLRVDIQSGSFSSGAQLLGAGGVDLSQVSPPAGDGRSSASADASSGGVVAANANFAAVGINQTVRASSAADLAVAGNVSVKADGTTDATTSISNINGGVVAVKHSATDIDTTSSTTAELGGQGRISGTATVLADSQAVQNASARAKGGGLVDVASATANSAATVDTRASLLGNADLTVDGALDVQSRIGGGISASTSVSSGGLVASSSGESSTRLSGLTSAGVAAGGKVDARTVSLLATNDLLSVNNNTSTSAKGLGVSDEARASATMNNKAAVDLGSNSVVQGRHGVDLRAGWSLSGSVSVYASADTDALGAYTLADASASQDNDATVTAAQSATVLAGARTTADPLQKVATYGAGGTYPGLTLFVETFGTGTGPSASTSYDDAVFDSGSDSHSTSNNATGSVVWDANVVIGRSTPAPEITIAADGSFTSPSGGPTLTRVGNEIVVGDIGGTSGAGAVLMRSASITEAIVESGANLGENFSVQPAYDQLTITNNSSLTLGLGRIDTTGTGKGLVRLEASGGDGAVGLKFNVNSQPNPTDLRIISTAATGGDIVLTSAINNPLGSTFLRSAGGSIRMTGSRADGAIITTRALQLEAGDQIGDATSARALVVDLIDPLGTGEDLSTRLQVSAGADVRLDLRGINRESGTVTQMRVDGSIRAGLSGQGGVNLLLQDSVKEADATWTGGGLTVTTPAGSADYVSSFRPDSSASAKPSGGYQGSNPEPLAALWAFGAQTQGATVLPGLQASGSGRIVVASANPSSSTLTHLQADSQTGSAGAYDINLSGTVSLEQASGPVRLLRLSGSGDVSFEAKQGSLIVDSASSSGKLSLEAAGALTLTTASAGADASLKASQGDLSISQSLSAGGAATLEASGAISLNRLSAGAATTVTALGGGLNAQQINSGGDTVLKAAGAVSLQTVVSGGLTTVEAQPGALNLGSLSSVGQVDLSSSAAITIQTLDSQAGLKAVAEAGALTAVSLKASAAVDLQASLGITVTTLQAGGTTDLRALGGSVQLDSLTSGGATQLSASQAVTLRLLDSAGSTTVSAAGGDIVVDQTHSVGNLQFSASGLIRMGYILGDAAVSLRSDGGDLYDLTGALPGSDDVRIRAKAVSLVATAGAIGRGVSDTFRIDSDGPVYVLARDSVALTEVSGGLELDSVTSRFGDVLLETLAGSLSAVPSDGKATIQGRNIDLLVAGGIGSASRSVDLFGAGTGQLVTDETRRNDTVPNPGRLVVVAQGDSYLRSLAGTLVLLDVGTSQGSLKVSTLNSALKDEAIRLATSPGSTLRGQAVASGTVHAPGLVTLSAGDRLTLDAGTRVHSDVAIQLEGDVGQVDEDPNQGSFIILNGIAEAPEVIVQGGDDMDEIELNNGQLNPAGTVTLLGGGAEDHFYVSAAGQDLTLDGQAGPDRFFVSSSAAWSRMAPNGYFDNSLDALTAIGGDLSSITATVTIKGAGLNNGGVLDVAYLGASGASANLTGEISASSRKPGSVELSGMSLGTGGSIILGHENGLVVALGLGQGNDSLLVSSLPSTVFLSVQGAGGNDTLTVGNASVGMTGIAGVVGFQGDAGQDKLVVVGDAPASSTGANLQAGGQLSGVAVTGMGMGRNKLGVVHGDRYGITQDDVENAPGAVFYASRNRATGAVTPLVEEVVVQLGSGDDRFAIDSVAAGVVARVNGGAGTDTLVVGSTASGLTPMSLRRVDGVAGELHLDGGSSPAGAPDQLVLDDGGDITANVGTWQGTQLSGLGISGSVRIDSADDAVTVELGQGRNSFYVPSLAAGRSLTVHGNGTGIDRFVIGAAEGGEANGSLAGVQGQLLLDGAGPESSDSLLITDSASTANTSFLVSNLLDASSFAIGGGKSWRWDSTTVTSSAMGAGAIVFRRLENVGLQAGQGNDSIDIQGTQREQSYSGLASTFSVNAGLGNDSIIVGTPVSGGRSLETFFIDVNGRTDTSGRGVPVLVQGGGGQDSLSLDDSATAQTIQLAFDAKRLDGIFPSSTANWVSALKPVLGAGLSASTLMGGAILSRSGVAGTLNVWSMDTDELRASLGSGNDVVQFGAGTYQQAIMVYAGAGDDSFTIDAGVDNRGHLATLNGQSGDDLAYFDFDGYRSASATSPEAGFGVPDGKAFFQFNGGSQSLTGQGDMLRLSGDAQGSARYTASASESSAGSLAVTAAGGSSANQIGFTGVEPVVVHGLASFTVDDGQAVADVSIGATDLASLHLNNLRLQTQVVEGVASWTVQPPSLLVSQTAVEVRHSGQTMASSGDYLAVGAEQLDAPEKGAVTLYHWNGSTWVEDTQLLAPDAASGGGAGFGRSLAMYGDTLVVGAPLDGGLGTAAGAVYVYVRNGNAWQFQARLEAADGAALAAFGTSLAISGDTLVVGSPGQADSAGETFDATYVFQRSGSSWTQLQRLVNPVSGVSDFGRSVGIAGDTLAVGRPSPTPSRITCWHLRYIPVRLISADTKYPMY